MPGARSAADAWQSVEDDMLQTIVAQGDQRRKRRNTRQQIELRGGKHGARRFEVGFVEQQTSVFFSEKDAASASSVMRIGGCRVTKRGKTPPGGPHQRR